jgi:hypothetical protein
MSHKDFDDRKGLEQEFQGYANVFNAIEILKQAVDNGSMSIDAVAKALTGTKAALDLVGKISDIATKSAMLDLQESVISLRTELLEIKESLLEGKEENLNLKQENLDLKEKVKQLKNEAPGFQLEKRGKLYYAKDLEDPVCYNCSMEKSTPIVMSRLAVNTYKCNKCNHLIH